MTRERGFPRIADGLTGASLSALRGGLGREGALVDVVDAKVAGTAFDKRPHDLLLRQGRKLHDLLDERLDLIDEHSRCYARIFLSIPRCLSIAEILSKA